MQKRGLSVEVINYFVKDLKILYEEGQHHNLVFCGKDKQGEIRYANLRGTYDSNGKKFKGDVFGSNKDYNVNIINLDNSILKVFEASIDLMSFLDLTGDYQSNKLVLGTNTDKSLNHFLKENPHIKKIGFYLDNDKPAKEKLFGKAAVVDESTGKILKQRKEGLLEKYTNLGYEVKPVLVPENTGCKDYNEFLLFMKENIPNRIWINVSRDSQMRDTDGKKKARSR